jgi:hypothetical protein
LKYGMGGPPAQGPDGEYRALRHPGGSTGARAAGDSGRRGGMSADWSHMGSIEPTDAFVSAG